MVPFSKCEMSRAGAEVPPVHTLALQLPFLNAAPLSFFLSGQPLSAEPHKDGV